MKRCLVKHVRKEKQMSNSSIRYPTAPISDLESTEVVTLSNSLIIDQPDSTRKTTLASILSSLGIMRCISFSNGGVLESQKDIAFYEEDGTFYTWNGPYPKIVEAGSTPKESGGVGSNAWINNKDTPLVRVWKYRAAVDGETTIQLPKDIPIVDVQAIYVQGLRQDLNEGFTYNAADSTIILADELEAGDLVTVIIGIADLGTGIDIFAALKGTDGASNVGTSSGDSVQDVLDNLLLNNQQLTDKLASNNGASNIGTLGGITAEDALSNSAANIREHWRRQLSDAGLNLVDGSFEEGATANSSTDAVWHIAGGQCYTWDGSFPKTVPSDSTPTSTGGVGTGVWVSVGDAALRTELGKDDGYKLIGGLEERLPLVDISATGGANDSAKLNSLFAQYKDKSVILYSSDAATYTIDSNVTCYGNFDFSNLTFNLSGGKVIYADEREESQRTKTITLTGYPLAELTSTLASSDSLVGWENSLVKIVSPTEVDLYRLLKSVYTPRYKGEVNFMTKPGELAYSLKNTYNDPVTCTLFKLPTKRNKIVLPRLTGQLSRHAFDIQRSLVDVEVVYFNDMGMTATGSNIFGSSTTYGVNWKLTSAGITQTDNNSRYTISMEYALKHYFIGCEVGKGWRSIDGNYCRDIVVRDSCLDSFHMHYGCSKILVDNCRIPGGVLVGTGAFDEATQIINSHIGPFGVRTDYGEHKGDFIVRGGSVRIPEGSSGLVDMILCRSDNVIASGNPAQPRTLHLPKNIIVQTNIYWPSEVTLNILSFKNNFKTQPSPLRDFKMPSLIDFTGSTFNGKDARFELAISYHDASTRDIPVIKLTPSESTGCKVVCYVGHISEYASCLYALETNMDVTFMNITSGMSRSYIKVTNGIIRRFVGYSASITYMQGSVYFDKSYISWDTANNFVSGFMSVSDCLIDGTAAGTPTVNTYVHRSANNICYNIVATDSRDTVDKKHLLCSRDGAAGNFVTGEITVSN